MISVLSPAFPTLPGQPSTTPTSDGAAFALTLLEAGAGVATREGRQGVAASGKPVQGPAIELPGDPLAWLVPETPGRSPSAPASPVALLPNVRLVDPLRSHETLLEPAVAPGLEVAPDARVEGLGAMLMRVGEDPPPDISLPADGSGPDTDADETRVDPDAAVRDAPPAAPPQTVMVAPQPVSAPHAELPPDHGERGAVDAPAQRSPARPRAIDLAAAPIASDQAVAAAPPPRTAEPATELASDAPLPARPAPGKLAGPTPHLLGADFALGAAIRPAHVSGLIDVAGLEAAASGVRPGAAPAFLAGPRPPAPTEAAVPIAAPAQSAAPPAVPGQALASVAEPRLIAPPVPSPGTVSEEFPVEADAVVVAERAAGSDRSQTLTPAPLAAGSGNKVEPTPAMLRPAVTGPAAQVFAAALRRGARDQRPAVMIEAAVHALAAPVDGSAVSVPATSTPLDLRQERWPEVMVERIERLRDAAEASSTRIRLVPDALGPVDIAVRREGEAVHVHFTAEQAATRALLQDATSRLAEAAESRGLKLGQTSVGDGGANRDGGQRPADRPLPTAPRPATPAGAEAAETDNRIA